MMTSCRCATLVGEDANQGYPVDEVAEARCAHVADSLERVVSRRRRRGRRSAFDPSRIGVDAYAF
jgi:hypothetical protein